LSAGGRKKEEEKNTQGLSEEADPGGDDWGEFPPFEDDQAGESKPVPPPKPPAFVLPAHENDAGHNSLLSPLRSPASEPVSESSTPGTVQTNEAEVAQVTDELMGIVNSKSKWMDELQSILVEITELNPTAGGDLNDLNFTQLLVRMEAMTAKAPPGQRMRDYNGRAGSSAEQQKFLTALRAFYEKHDPSGEKYPTKPEVTAPLHEVLDYCRKTWQEEPELEYCRSFSMNYLVNFDPLEHSTRKGKAAAGKKREIHNENLKSGVRAFKNLPITAELLFDVHGCSSKYIVGSGKSGHLQDKETSLLPNLYDYAGRIKVYLPDMLQVQGPASQTHVLDNSWLLGLQRTVEKLCTAGVIDPLHTYVELSRLVKNFNSLASKYDRDASEYAENARVVIDNLTNGPGFEGGDSPANDAKFRSRTVVAMDYGSGQYEHSGKDRADKQEDKAHTFCTKALAAWGKRCDELQVVWEAFIRFVGDYDQIEHGQWDTASGDAFAWGLQQLDEENKGGVSGGTGSSTGSAAADAGPSGRRELKRQSGYKNEDEDRSLGSSSDTPRVKSKKQSYAAVMESLAHAERVMEQYSQWLARWLVDARHGAAFLRSHIDDRARKEVAKFCGEQLTKAKARCDEDRSELQTECTEGRERKDAKISKTLASMEELLTKHSAAAVANEAGGAGGRGGEVDVVATAGAYYRVRKGELQDSMQDLQQRLAALQKRLAAEAAAVRKCEDDEASRARDERYLSLSATGTRMKTVAMRALILQIRVSFVTVQAAMYSLADVRTALQQAHSTYAESAQHTMRALRSSHSRAVADMLRAATNGWDMNFRRCIRKRIVAIESKEFLQEAKAGGGTEDDRSGITGRVHKRMELELKEVEKARERLASLTLLIIQTVMPSVHVCYFQQQAIDEADGGAVEQKANPGNLEDGSQQATPEVIPPLVLGLLQRFGLAFGGEPFLMQFCAAHSYSGVTARKEAELEALSGRGRGSEKRLSAFLRGDVVGAADDTNARFTQFADDTSARFTQFARSESSTGGDGGDGTEDAYAPFNDILAPLTSHSGFQVELKRLLASAGGVFVLKSTRGSMRVRNSVDIVD
jgi:hypothetical protein